MIQTEVSSTQGRRFRCLCDCGTIREVRLGHLRNGAIQSCGCLRSEVSAALQRRHGAACRGGQTPEFKVWIGIRKRCFDSNSTVYSYYGGRGIEMCERWRGSFEAFLEDVGKKPSSEMTIDRIDNGRGYEPGNVRWATRKEQGRNRRSNRIITHRGETRTLAEWAEVVGLSYGTLHDRLNRSGWEFERAITQPVKRS